MIGREMIVKKILFTVLCLCAVFLLMPVTAEANQIVTETEVSYPDTAERDEILKYIGTDSGWKDIRGNFKSVSVNAKNYLPMEKSAESDGNIGYSMVLRVTMDNGKFYAFRIINDTGVKYVYNRFGANGLCDAGRYRIASFPRMHPRDPQKTAHSHEQPEKNHFRGYSRLHSDGSDCFFQCIYAILHQLLWRGLHVRLDRLLQN